MRRTTTALTLTALLLTGCAQPARHLTTLPTAAAERTPPSWTVNATPYGWLAGLSGQVGFNDAVADIDLGFGEIARHLRFAGMAAVNGRNGSFLVGADAIYVSLSGGKAFAVRGASGEVTLDQRETILHPTIGYTFGTTSWGVDALAGLRYWNLSTALGLDPARLEARSRSGTIDWLDGTAGVRGRVTVARRIHVTAEGDGGGGGSRRSWQAAGAVNYDLSQRSNLVAGYRYLSVDFESNRFLFDTHMNGVVLGVNFRL